MWGFQRDPPPQQPAAAGDSSGPDAAIPAETGDKPSPAQQSAVGDPSGPKQAEGEAADENLQLTGQPAQPTDDRDDATLKPFEAAFQELRKWVDPSEGQYALLSAQREQLAGRYASAVK